MIKPSLTSLRMARRELALLIPDISFGSSQILRLPALRTLAARRLWNFKLGLIKLEIRISFQRMDGWISGRTKWSRGNETYIWWNGFNRGAEVSEYQTL